MRRREPSIISIIALLILVIGIPATIVAINLGFNPFAFASPTESPAELVVANVTDTSVTVSFLTPAAPTDALIKYGTAADALNLIASDTRDLTTGQSGAYRVHTFEISNLNPGTEYFFAPVIGGTTYNNGNTPYSFETFTTLDAPAVPNPKYGSVNPTSAGALVRAHAVNDGTVSTPISTLTADNGTFTFDAGSLRTQDGEVFDLQGAEVIAVIATEDNARGGVQFDASAQPGRVAITGNSTLAYSPVLTALPETGITATPTFTTGSSPTTTPTVTVTGQPTATVTATVTPTVTATTSPGEDDSVILTAAYSGGLEQTDSSAPHTVFISNLSVNGFTVNWLTKEPTTGAVVVSSQSTQYLDNRDTSSSQSARYTHMVDIDTSDADPGDLISFQLTSNNKTFSGIEDFRFSVTVPEISDSPPSPASIEGTVDTGFTRTIDRDLIIAGQGFGGGTTWSSIPAPQSGGFSLSYGDLVDPDTGSYVSPDQIRIVAYGEYNSSDTATADPDETVALDLEPGVSFTDLRQSRSYSSPPRFTGTAPAGSTVLIDVNGTEYSATADSGGQWRLSDLSSLTAGQNTISASAAGDIVATTFSLDLELLPDTAIENWGNLAAGALLVLAGLVIKRIITVTRYQQSRG
ncbi:MAG: hypothetical protein TR69_WS6001000512 [candidate division WS6 bacterium OLB20]|uniref:Purple acid phosphatase N-terminal domain-containing protein n=1 Tax=candidate division WS6 bacterium OLB20 TaxID=1617426 RepID=A0A136LXW8_9BACT|nr:MAG: hypothetical protein TR69_WS6001000512 [candidate division WS6 bacterium OLB20]